MLMSSKDTAGVQIPAGTYSDFPRVICIELIHWNMIFVDWFLQHQAANEILHNHKKKLKFK